MDFLADEIVFMSCFSIPTFEAIWSMIGSKPISLFLDESISAEREMKWAANQHTKKIRYSEAKEVFICWWLNFCSSVCSKNRKYTIEPSYDNNFDVKG